MFDRISPRARARRRADATDQALVDEYCHAWERACEGAGLVRTVQTVSGPTVLIPRIVDMTLGPPLSFIVQLLPGELPEDVRAVGHRVAPWLGGQRLRVAAHGRTHVTVTVIDRDPLDATVPPAPPVATMADPLLLGRDELGDDVRLALVDATHLIIQGSSGSGKSIGTYGLLSQLAEAPDVMVTGSDITNLLLAPWAEHTRSSGWQTCGTAVPAKHVEILERLVTKMDQRIREMPARADQVQLGPDCPLVVVVLEEYPGLLRMLKTKDKSLDQRARAAVGRLLGEGRKAGFRVLLITQRADADIVGGYERGQASHTISYRVDKLDALRMLHPDVDAQTAAEHATAMPGVALLSAPGAGLLRLRAPYVPFGDYWAAVESGGAAA